jgi:plasmid stabilization system protein ParE
VTVRLSDEAEFDLEGIGDHIAADNPTRAVTFIGELVDACRGLADFPARFPIAERYAAAGIRQRVHGNYLIYYRVSGDDVEVIRIVHGAIDSAWLPPL